MPTTPIISSAREEMVLETDGITAKYVPTTASVIIPNPPGAGKGCTGPANGARPTPTKQDFLKAFVGTWLLCQRPSVFGTNEVGLQIDANGRWAKLTRNSEGQLETITGLGNQGTWTVPDTSAMNGPGSFQVNLNEAGGRSVTTSPRFSSGPPGMLLNNEGVFIARYVPTTDRVVPAR